MEDLQSTIMILIVVGFVGMLVAGATKKVVIYYDGGDFFISIMTWGSILAGIILVNIYSTEGAIEYSTLQEIIRYGSFIMSGIFTILAMKLSIQHNRNIILGTIIGIFKIIASLIGIVVVVGQIYTFFSDNSNRKDTFIAMIIFGIFIWLGKQLINGEKVYENKGWLIEDEEQST